MLDMHQLDIFADSMQVQCVNSLIDALNRMDHIESYQALHALRDEEPEHKNLPIFQLLCEFVDDWHDRFSDPHCLLSSAVIATEEQFIQNHITPASRVMGKAGNDLLRKSWHGLAKASERLGIACENPDCFAAELYLRAQQYADVVRTALDIPAAKLRAHAQRWLALGYYGSGKMELAKNATLRYAWLAPQQFNLFVEETQNTKLMQDWQQFQSTFNEVDATWFPAWYAQEKKACPDIRDDLPAGDGASAYRLVQNLTIRERSGLCPALYEDRAKLKRLDEEFFAYYMKCRAVSRV